MLKIGFFGAGKMAQALTKGFIRAGLTKADLVLASCDPTDKQSAEEFASLGSKVTFDNAEVTKTADILIMAVKPVVLPTVLENIRPYVNEEKLLISVAMGVPIKFIEQELRAESRVVRVMSNTPVLIQQGASVFARGSSASDHDVQVTKQLFGSVGSCDEVSEYILDPITALSGSGPAFVYIFIEALADGAVRMGIPRNLAYKLAAQTVVGAGSMVLNTGEHPAKLKDDVTSPAGSTAEGLFSLETDGFRGSVISALESATDKCIETSKKINKN